MNLPTEDPGHPGQGWMESGLVPACGKRLLPLPNLWARSTSSGQASPNLWEAKTKPWQNPFRACSVESWPSLALCRNRLRRSNWHSNRLAAPPTDSERPTDYTSNEPLKERDPTRFMVPMCIRIRMSWLLSNSRACCPIRTPCKKRVFVLRSPNCTHSYCPHTRVPLCRSAGPLTVLSMNRTRNTLKINKTLEDGSWAQSASQFGCRGFP